KARLALDLLLPAGRPRADESLASFVRRRLGKEALERLAQPLLGGIYTADPERLSLAATMPQLLEMERRQGSVIRGLRRQGSGRSASGARYNLLHSFRDGMQALAEALASRLPDVRHGSRLDGLDRVQDGWRLRLSGGRQEVFDAVCLCLPAPEVVRLLPELPAHGIGYASSATINLGFRREQIAHPLDGMGFVVPDVERRSIIACTFSSVKYAGRAPEGRVLLRAFAGGATHPDRYAVADGEMVEAALRDLRDLLGVRGEPEIVWLSRWPESMAQYDVGHLDRVRALDEAASRLPGLALAGAAYRGVGVPDCVASGLGAANKLLCQLGSI
ncbi:MAG: protoporphyrinogen oxidase, partial [Chloroflexota bacterium]